MWRSVASNFLTILIVLLAGLAVLVAWGRSQYTEPGPLAEAICLRVAPGSSFGDVADDLSARGAVTSGYILKVGADYEGKAASLKAGSFLVEPGASMQDIVEAVTGGGQSTCGTDVNLRIGVSAADIVVRELVPATGEFTELARFDPAAEEAPEAYRAALDETGTEIRVTVAEGTTAWQVVEALRLADFLGGEVPEVPGEGTLAPGSYAVDPGLARADLLAQMAARQSEALARLWAARPDGLPYETPEEALIMASIIEKETAVPEERGLVASVFYNRLQQGMKLQTDPTVIYGITKGQGVLGRGLRQSELRGETPYNTYVIDGLPPTPIANPGEASIEAALNPERTDYLFFVADGTGGHAFAETLAEHNENVARWREIEAERAAAEGDEAGATGTQDAGE